MPNSFYQATVPVALMVLANIVLFQVNALAQYGVEIGLIEIERVYEDPTDSTFIEYREQLKDSLQKWQSVKKECQGNYRFSRYHSAPMTTFRSLMTTTVRDGKLVRREYKTFTNQTANGITGKPQKTGWQVQWVEEGDELGSHPGHPLMTMDELYAEADKLLRLKRRLGEQLSIKFEDRGLLDYCYIVENAAACGGLTLGFPSLNLVIE